MIKQIILIGMIAFAASSINAQKTAPHGYATFYLTQFPAGGGPIDVIIMPQGFTGWTAVVLPITTTAINPTCGAPGCATFMLNDGTYSYDVTSKGVFGMFKKEWKGTLIIKNGDCQKIRLQ